MRGNVREEAELCASLASLTRRSRVVSASAAKRRFLRRVRFPSNPDKRVWVESASPIGWACPRSTLETRDGDGGRATGQSPSRGQRAPTAFAREPVVSSARAVRRDAGATKTRHRRRRRFTVAAVRVRERAVNAGERRTLTEPSAAEEERVKADIFAVET